MTSNRLTGMRPVLARRSVSFEMSPWAAADALHESYPDPILFGNGAPAAACQPIERLREASAIAWSEASGALDYGELAGYAPLRELILDRLATRGISAKGDDILVTSGSQQGIDLVAKLMLDPGDGIIVEGPTYIGAMQVFDAYEAHYFVCPVDSDGLCPDTLEQLLGNPENRIKMIYTMPVFQNPTGSIMSEERRGRLLNAAARHGVLVVEDDPYGELWFDTPPPAALRSVAEDVIYLGTFSKTIAPGIRVGWMVAPPQLMPLLLLAKEGVDINSDRIMTRTVYHTAIGFLDDHIAELRGFYAERRDALVDTLVEVMPADITIPRPNGGFFEWIELGDDEDSVDLLRVAAEHGVGFLPGAWFYPAGQSLPNGLRMSFSAMSLERIVEGATRLGAAMADYRARS